MKKFDELLLAKELIRFPTITPIDAGIMKYLKKNLYLDVFLKLLCLDVFRKTPIFRCI